uniref:Claudin n=1 Tax=Gopherus agassizii TaxID=38772 RepID=A0A452I4I7_9SAUR
MANSGLQLLGFVLALLGWVALIAATILPQWRMSSYAGDNIITSVAVYQGLWMSCAWQSTGQIQCKAYDSILNLSSALQATRALMVVSIVMGIIGIGVASMGMKCTRCGGDNKVQKARIAMTGGLIFVVGGESRKGLAGGLPLGSSMYLGLEWVGLLGRLAETWAIHFMHEISWETAPARGDR